MMVRAHSGFHCFRPDNPIAAMKKQESKPKPTSQQELLQYQAQADGTAEAAKAAKQRLRKAKAAVKLAREAYREAKRVAAEARGTAKAARKYFEKHSPKDPKPSAPARSQARKKTTSRKVTKVPPVATGPVPLGQAE
jgi:hypothetical protein